MAKPPKLGRYLEWHGNRIRVAVRAPPRLGRKLIREVLVTKDPLEAEREKVDVVRRIKARIRGEKIATKPRTLTEEALGWRDAYIEARQPDHGVSPSVVSMALDARFDQIVREHGEAAASHFAAVAHSVETPLDARVDDWSAGRPRLGALQTSGDRARRRHQLN